MGLQCPAAGCMDFHVNWNWWHRLLTCAVCPVGIMKSKFALGCHFFSFCICNFSFLSFGILTFCKRWQKDFSFELFLKCQHIKKSSRIQEQFCFQTTSPCCCLWVACVGLPAFPVHGPCGFGSTLSRRFYSLVIGPAVTWPTFPSLAGAAGPRLFTIHQIDACTNNLPKAHTWWVTVADPYPYSVFLGEILDYSSLFELVNKDFLKEEWEATFTWFYSEINSFCGTQQCGHCQCTFARHVYLFCVNCVKCGFAYSQLQSNRHSALWKLWKALWEAANGHRRDMWLCCGVTDFKDLPGRYLYPGPPPFQQNLKECWKTGKPPSLLKLFVGHCEGKGQFWNSFSRNKRSLCFAMRPDSAAI